jgi:glycosyltransferase involved in cell wall biosynthesis
MHKFVIVIPSYNNCKYARQNILSALSQNHPNFRIIFTDDHSSDDTFSIVKGVCQKYPNVKVDFIKNTERKGAMANFYTMISPCDPDEIVISLDGDDWLAHPDVLKRLELEYNKDVWMTYGQYLSASDRRRGISKQIPENIIQTNSFRRYDWASSHLRTFYAGLFQKIDVNDFKRNDVFFPITCDLGIMFPMLEMAGTRSSFIPDILCMYNDFSPINDCKVNRNLQVEFEIFIKGKKPYQPLEKLL